MKRNGFCWKGWVMRRILWISFTHFIFVLAMVLPFIKWANEDQKARSNASEASTATLASSATKTDLHWIKSRRITAVVSSSIDVFDFCTTIFQPSNVTGVSLSTPKLNQFILQAYFMDILWAKLLTNDTYCQNWREKKLTHANCLHPNCQMAFYCSTVATGKHIE